MSLSVSVSMDTNMDRDMDKDILSTIVSGELQQHESQGLKISMSTFLIFYVFSIRRLSHSTFFPVNVSYYSTFCPS
jgi:hypothetical protein